MLESKQNQKVGKQGVDSPQLKGQPVSIINKAIGIHLFVDVNVTVMTHMDN